MSGISERWLSQTDSCARMEPQAGHDRNIVKMIAEIRRLRAENAELKKGLGVGLVQDAWAPDK